MAQPGAYGGQAGAYGGQAGAYGGQPAQMSQQATTSMLLSSAKVNPRLRQLMDNDKNNQECADCSTQNPTWASYNIGVFLCEKCCGVHRRIGTHISKPRSIDLDEWTPAHLEAMEVVGNTNADAYWCYNVPIGRSKPEEGDAMVIITDWIQSKYEQKQFCKRPGAASERTDPGVAAYEKSGFIEKMGGAKDGGKWQRRWFELKNFQLSYYKSPPEPGKKVVPKGIIPITPQVVIKCSTAMGVDGEQVQDRMIEGNGFIVRDPSQGRDFNLRTEAGDDVSYGGASGRLLSTRNAEQSRTFCFCSKPSLCCVRVLMPYAAVAGRLGDQAAWGKSVRQHAARAPGD